MDLVALARAAVERHPAVTSVQLVGSRARGDPTALSDWDFLIETGDVDAVADALPALVADAAPLAAQWDRLSEEASYFMLVLSDGTKVDFVLQRPPDLQPAWVVTREAGGRRRALLGLDPVARRQAAARPGRARGGDAVAGDVRAPARPDGSDRAAGDDRRGDRALRHAARRARARARRQRGS